MTEKLKPCPFCGTIPTIEKRLLWWHYGSYEYDIHCHNCGCCVNMEGNNTIYHSDEEAEMNAVKAWNRRANENENKGGDNP